MRRVHLYVVVFLASALCVVMLLTRGYDRKLQPAPEGFTFGPAIPDAIKLPESISGKPIDGPVENAIFLHVNRDGEVIPPFDRATDTGTLSNPAQVEDYLKRRADLEKTESGKDRPEAVPILRIDRETPFGKSYPILKTCKVAGYEKYQLRVLPLVGSVETHISMTFPQHAELQVVDCGVDITAEQPKQYVVKVVADDTGQIAGLTFREYGSTEEGGEDLGLDLESCRKKLALLVEIERKRIAIGEAKGSKIPPPWLRLEIADKLLHQSVVQLLDVGLQAGFTDVWFMPIAPKQR